LDFPAIEFDGNGMIRPAQVNTAVQRLDEYFSNRIAFASLYDQYEALFYWFEFGCTMRKMILTGALVLFGAGTTQQIVTALAVCIFWFGIIANLNPFEDEIDDRLAQVEAIQILFTLLIGLVLQLQATSEEGTDGEEDALGVVLIVLNLAVIAFAFIQQPIFLMIASRVSAVAVCIKERAVSCGKTEDVDAAAADDAVTGIEMQNNPSHADNRTGGAGEAATRIEIRGNPLVSATRIDGLRADAGCIEGEQLGGAEITQLRAENDKLKRENEQLKQAQLGLARSSSKIVAPERRRQRATGGSARRRACGAEIEKSKLGRQRQRSKGRTNRSEKEEEAMLERREKRRQESIAVEKVRWRTISHSGMQFLNLVLSPPPPSPSLLKLGHLGTQRKKSGGEKGKTAEGSQN